MTGYTEDGKAVLPKALCYVSDWYIGFTVLTAYKAGTYTPGLEKELVNDSNLSSSDMSKFIQKLLTDYTLMTRSTEDKVLTFSELYQLYYKWKYNGKKYIRSNQNTLHVQLIKTVKRYTIYQSIKLHMNKCRMLLIQFL